MTRKLLLGMVVAVGTAGSVQAQEFNIIETRQAGQDLLSGNFTRHTCRRRGEGRCEDAGEPRQGDGAVDEAVPDEFPAGSDKAPTKALSPVWSDPTGFHKAADDFVAAADKLTQLAKAGDAEGVEAQVKVVGDACAACHRTYRQR